MKKTIFTLLLTAAMLGGCVREIDEINMPEQTNIVSEESEAESETEETAVIPEAAADMPESPAETVEFPEIVLPEIVYSIREADLSMIPEGLVIDEKFTGYLSNAIFEQIGIENITARVTIIQNNEVHGLKNIYAEYEVYPNNAEFCEGNLLYGPLNVGLELNENGRYYPGSPMMIDTEGIAALGKNYEEYKKNPQEYSASADIFLDSENRINLRRGEKFFVTDLYYKGNIRNLSECCIFEENVNNIVLLSCEDRFYSSPFRITVSRDGGMSWHTTYPELAPLGKNGQHAEVGFTASEIQFMPDGQIYIFVGTNLASMTVLTIPADSDEAVVLFREQIGGYETTALVNAAMVNETRGFYTLSHPKYAASNAIYRTTDGGNSWVRCSVPMPEECTDPWSMTLYLPYQPEGAGEHEWHMDGGWDGGECTYVSYDGGWTWTITEQPGNL